MPLDFTKTRVPGIAQSFRSAIDSGSLMSSTSPLVQKAAQLNYQGLASAGKSLGKGISDAGAAIGAGIVSRSKKEEEGKKKAKLEAYQDALANTEQRPASEIIADGVEIPGMPKDPLGKGIGDVSRLLLRRTNQGEYDDLNNDEKEDLHNFIRAQGSSLLTATTDDPGRREAMGHHAAAAPPGASRAVMNHWSRMGSSLNEYIRTGNTPMGIRGRSHQARHAEASRLRDSGLPAAAAMVERGLPRSAVGAAAQINSVVKRDPSKLNLIANTPWDINTVQRAMQSRQGKAWNFEVGPGERATGTVVDLPTDKNTDQYAIVHALGGKTANTDQVGHGLAADAAGDIFANDLKSGAFKGNKRFQLAVNSLFSQGEDGMGPSPEDIANYIALTTFGSPAPQGAFESIGGAAGWDKIRMKVEMATNSSPELAVLLSRNSEASKPYLDQALNGMKSATVKTDIPGPLAFLGGNSATDNLEALSRYQEGEWNDELLSSFAVQAGVNNGLTPKESQEMSANPAFQDGLRDYKSRLEHSREHRSLGSSAQKQAHLARAGNNWVKAWIGWQGKSKTKAPENVLSPGGGPSFRDAQTSGAKKKPLGQTMETPQPGFRVYYNGKKPTHYAEYDGESGKWESKQWPHQLPDVEVNTKALNLAHKVWEDGFNEIEDPFNSIEGRKSDLMARTLSQGTGVPLVDSILNGETSDGPAYLHIQRMLAGELQDIPEKAHSLVGYLSTALKGKGIRDWKPLMDALNKASKTSDDPTVDALAHFVEHRQADAKLLRTEVEAADEPLVEDKEIIKARQDEKKESDRAMSSIPVNPGTGSANFGREAAETEDGDPMNYGGAVAREAESMMESMVEGGQGTAAVGIGGTLAAITGGVKAKGGGLSGKVAGVLGKIGSRTGLIAGATAGISAASHFIPGAEPMSPDEVPGKAIEGWKKLGQFGEEMRRKPRERGEKDPEWLQEFSESQDDFSWLYGGQERQNKSSRRKGFDKEKKWRRVPVDDFKRHAARVTSMLNRISEHVPALEGKASELKDILRESPFPGLFPPNGADAKALWSVGHWAKLVLQGGDRLVETPEEAPVEAAPYDLERWPEPHHDGKTSTVAPTQKKAAKKSDRALAAEYFKNKGRGLKRNPLEEATMKEASAAKKSVPSGGTTKSKGKGQGKPTPATSEWPEYPDYAPPQRDDLPRRVPSAEDSQGPFTGSVTPDNTKRSTMSLIERAQRMFRSKNMRERLEGKRGPKSKAEAIRRLIEEIQGAGGR